MSTLPSLDTIRAAFLAAHPGYVFIDLNGISCVQDLVWEATLKDPFGRPRTAYSAERFKSPRHQEWISYLRSLPQKIIAAARDYDRGVCHTGDPINSTVISGKWANAWPAESAHETLFMEFAYSEFRRTNTITVADIRQEVSVRAEMEAALRDMAAATRRLEVARARQAATAAGI
jgi:hypothetical protein